MSVSLRFFLVAALWDSEGLTKESRRFARTGSYRVGLIYLLSTS